GLVVGERRKAAGIGRRHHRLDREMAAVDAKFEIAKWRRLGRDDVHVDAETLAEHAARIADAAVGVERIASRQRMNDGAAFGHRMAAASGKTPADIDLGYRAGKRDAGRIVLA